MAISDSKAGKVIATLPIGGAVDGAGFDRATGLAFASNGEGTLTVVHEDNPDRFMWSPLRPRNGALGRWLWILVPTVSTPSPPIWAPPPASAEDPHPRPTVKPDSFTLLVLAP